MEMRRMKDDSDNDELAWTRKEKRDKLTRKGTGALSPGVLPRHSKRLNDLARQAFAPMRQALRILPNEELAAISENELSVGGRPRTRFEQLQDAFVQMMEVVPRTR